MNTYIYGPKDDPFHSASWREPYPADQAKLIKELTTEAARNKVDFVWAIHPGQDIKWNATDSNNVITKFEQMYDLGVRAFAVFFDDISGEGTNAAKQAGLMNFINHVSDRIQPFMGTDRLSRYPGRTTSPGCPYHVDRESCCRRYYPGRS